MLYHIVENTKFLRFISGEFIVNLPSLRNFWLFIYKVKVYLPLTIVLFLYHNLIQAWELWIIFQYILLFILIKKISETPKFHMLDDIYSSIVACEMHNWVQVLSSSMFAHWSSKMLLNTVMWSPQYDHFYSNISNVLLSLTYKNKCPFLYF